MYFFIEAGSEEIKEVALNDLLNKFKDYWPSRNIAEGFLDKNPSIKILIGDGNGLVTIPFKPIIYSERNFKNGLLKVLSKNRFRTMIPLYVSRSDVEKVIQIYEPAGIVDFYTSLQNFPGIIGYKSLVEKLDVETNEIYETDSYILMDSNKHKTLGPFLVEYFQAYQEMFPQYFEPYPEV